MQLRTSSHYQSTPSEQARHGQGVCMQVKHEQPVILLATLLLLVLQVSAQTSPQTTGRIVSVGGSGHRDRQRTGAGRPAGRRGQHQSPSAGNVRFAQVGYWCPVRRRGRGPPPRSGPAQQPRPALPRSSRCAGLGYRCGSLPDRPTPGALPTRSGQSAPPLAGKARLKLWRGKPRPVSPPPAASSKRPPDYRGPPPRPGRGAPVAAGRNTAADAMIRLAGGINAIDGYDGYKPASFFPILHVRFSYSPDRSRRCGGRTRRRPGIAPVRWHPRRP